MYSIFANTYQNIQERGEEFISLTFHEIGETQQEFVQELLQRAQEEAEEEQENNN
eukprot:m.96594 g.96594  ORF g.96594 m.96594 type:complete len:55 (-) comp12471_c1_seq1:1708-1872(-)